MKILIIFLPGLGNAILLEPTLRALKNHQVDLYIKEKIVKILYENSGLINNFIHYPSFPFRKYDYVFSTSSELHFKEKLFMQLILAKKKLLYKYDPNVHERDCDLQIAKKIGTEIHDIHPRIYIPQNAKNFLPKINKLTIGFHPGCSEELKFKRWSWRKFAEVADILAVKSRIVIFGGPEEVALSQKIVKIMTKQPIILTGKANILETAKAIGNCDLFITNDSGLMHVASAMQVPTVAIFGPTNAIKNAPLVKNHIILENNNLDKILIRDVLKAIYELQKTLRKTVR